MLENSCKKGIKPSFGRNLWPMVVTRSERLLLGLQHGWCAKLEGTWLFTKNLQRNTPPSDREEVRGPVIHSPIRSEEGGGGTSCRSGFCGSTLNNGDMYSGRRYNSGTYDYKKRVSYNTKCIEGFSFSFDACNIWIHCFLSWIWGPLYSNIWLLGWSTTAWYGGVLVKTLYWKSWGRRRWWYRHQS